MELASDILCEFWSPVNSTYFGIVFNVLLALASDTEVHADEYDKRYIPNDDHDDDGDHVTDGSQNAQDDDQPEAHSSQHPLLTGCIFRCESQKLMHLRCRM